MVCRENKGRSAIMGFQKHLADQMRGPGEIGLIDNEYQSAIHETGHLLGGYSPMSVPEQIAMWKGIRQSIANNPTISDTSKYRVSQGRGGQPGLITRVDQELQRLESGEDEHGKPLRPEQMNSGPQLAAVQRLGAMLSRITPAKDAFLEINARGRGITKQQSQDEWNTLMNRSGNFSSISLTDAFRDNLSSAGLTSQAQADLGQSGKSRDTMRVMEERRQAALGAAPSRPTPLPERVDFVKPDAPEAQVRCEGEGGCGRFGHTIADCPNQGRLAEAQQLTARATHAAAVGRAFNASFTLADAENGLDYDGSPYTDETLPDGSVITADEAQRAAIAYHRSELEHLSDEYGIDPDSITTKTHAAAQKEMRDAETRLAGISAEMDATQPRVSTAVQRIEYNRDTGLCVVTAHPYTRKGDGQTVQRSYAYRVSGDEFDKLSESDSPGKDLNESVWRKGAQRPPNDAFKFENPADESAAFTQHQCPTCGQWAAMNSSHTCRVKGSKRRAEDDDDVDTGNRTALAMYRDRFRTSVAQNTQPPLPPLPTKLVMSNGQHRPLAPGITGSLARADAVAAAVAAGNVVRTPVIANTPGGKVTGTVTVWQDPGGAAIVSAAPEAGGKGLACSCGTFHRTGTCQDMRAVLSVTRRAWKAGVTTESDRLVPGGPPLVKVREGVAQDAPRGEVERVDYRRIINSRREATQRQRAAYNKLVEAGGDMSAPRAVPPLDAQTGQPVAWPTTWTRADGTGHTIDLANTETVRLRLRGALTSRSRDGYSVLADGDGTIRVAVPRKYRNADGTVPYTQRARLAEYLGVPVGAVDDSGYRVPADPSWRQDTLDRAYGDPRRIEPAAWTI